MSQNKHWKVLDSVLGWDGFFKLTQYQIQHERYDGSLSPPLEREVFQLGSAAAVLIHDPDLDLMLLVEQFRAGSMNVPYGPWMTELVAGLLEPGESPEDLVVREAMEEANVEINTVLPIAHYQCSPGAVTQEFFLYYAQADLSNAGGVYGLASEGEDIKVVVMPAQQALAELPNGGFNNAMTVIALQWFQLQRLQGHL